MKVGRQIFSEQTLEATIARLVSEALRACGEDLSECNLAKIGITSAVEPQTPAPDKALGATIDSQVVSLKVLESLSLPEGAKQIWVRPGAVITPAAKDFLRQQQISVKQTICDQIAGEVKPKIGSVIIADGELPGRAEALSRQLSLRGLETGVGTLNDIAAGAKSKITLSIVVSSLPAIEADLLSRVHSLRTATADSIEAARRIGTRFTPQAWILDSERLTLSGLVAVAETCIRIRSQGSISQGSIYQGSGVPGS